MFMEFHILQSFPPANLNRDDTNNPKDALFGGVRRARISSQSFKRAIRTTPVFKRTLEAVLEHPVGVRTRHPYSWMEEELRERYHKDPEEIKKVLQVLMPSVLVRGSGAKAKNKRKRLREDPPEVWGVLLYLSPYERAFLAEKAVEAWDELLAGNTKIADKIGNVWEKQKRLVPDIALFGRMLADAPVLQVEAATQVAHALSTHRISMEMDFYTAVDDLSQDDETGAGMMGYTGYDSATFYRYLRLDWQQLKDNLGGDLEMARRTVEGFIRAMIEAVPSGKQNAFAAYTPPGLVLGVVRTGSFAWSLVNAFEKPVRPKGGYMRPSVEALDGYWGRITAVYGEDSVKAKAVLALEEDLPLQHLKADLVPDLATFLKRMLEALPGGEA